MSRFKLFERGEKRVGVIVGCGPSLSIDQLDKVARLRKFGANRSFEFGMDVVLGCNFEFWDHYWDRIKLSGCQMWTSHPKAVKRPGLNHIEGLWKDGLSTDPNYIHYHHGSGPQAVNLALHYGCKVMLLIGWDMRYLGKVDNRTYTGRRHYFGEDALTKGHYPRTGDQGEFTGLIKEMATIHPEDYGIEIINCTPESAMTCFPMMDLDEALERYT